MGKDVKYLQDGGEYIVDSDVQLQAAISVLREYTAKQTQGIMERVNQIVLSFEQAEGWKELQIGVQRLEGNCSDVPNQFKIAYSQNDCIPYETLRTLEDGHFWLW
ncbi:MAG: hypothetical protein ABIG95_00520 [Candidatus Woesearchaeota archaeon]